ncbi:Lrp/AsnC family transcriptional regulator [Candidatus Woesearchaeota archaeon]|nr:Lrp/AsnC family transcriptional regulator [Candidatus Woesearchaeota archaeon]
MPLNFDTKDQKILSELDVRARRSNSQIGKAVRLSKEVVKYRIDRLMDEGVILRFHTVINYFKLGIVKYKLYLRFTNANQAKIEDIAQYFRDHELTEWVAITTGRWDLIVGFLVRNANEFDDEMQQALNRFSAVVQEKAVTTTLYLAHQSRTFLKDKKDPAIQTVYHTTKDPQLKIHEMDEKILRILANHGRMPVTEIAQKIKTTARIVQYRIKELERKGVILAYKAHLDPKALGNIFCKLMLFLSNPPKEKLNRFITYVSTVQGAVWPQKVIGNWDFEIDFELESYDAFQNIILNLKEQFPDLIRNHEFCIVSKEFKLDLYPHALH